jgi:hypothetical protein
VYDLDCGGRICIVGACGFGRAYRLGSWIGCLGLVF